MARSMLCLVAHVSLRLPSRLAASSKREAHHALGAFAGNGLDGEATGTQFVYRFAYGATDQVERRQVCQVSFHTDVEVFQVFAHDDEVDAFRLRERTGAAGQVSARAHIGVGFLAPAQIVERRPSGAAR